MKKIFLGLAFGLGVLTSAQQYPNNGWGDDGYYQNGGGDYYSDEDDRNYFPDDYYYNYPQDYYPNDYYQSYYNDYRNSIINIDWNGFFVQNRLNRWQIDQILRLNNLYASFTAWNNFYRYNPDRWYYDRFYAIQRILGPRVFVVFQNNYYRGSSPIVYFQNYRRTYYVPRYTVMPRYRNININVYRVDRSRFRRMDNPTFDIVRRDNGAGGGFRNTRTTERPGSFRDNNSGFRNSNGMNNGSTAGNGGFRNSNGGGFRNNSDNGGNRGNSDNNGGFRNSNGGGFRGNSEVRREAPRREDNGGFPNSNGGGFRQRSESSAPRQESRGNGGGFRGSLVKN